MKVLAIDPGSEQSGYVLFETNNSEFESKGNVLNGEIINVIENDVIDHVAIEMIASYGMAVGQTTFDTCVWVGEFRRAAKYRNLSNSLIYRKEVKMALCNSVKAKDSNITQALIDRYAPDTPNKGKGNATEPGFFYGFAKDIWQAFAVCETHLIQQGIRKP